MEIMKLTVNANLPARVVIGATGLAGLAQEVRTVITTRKGSVPLDRDFGVDWAVIDRPVGAVLPAYIADVAMQIERYVPRVRVVSVTYESSTNRGGEQSPPGSASRAASAAFPAAGSNNTETVDGILRPVVTVTIRKEYRDELT